MLKFRYKKTIRERVHARCERHPRYNPEKEGRDGIKGGCTTCWQLFDLDQARTRLDVAIHDFERRSAPWSVAPTPRRPSNTDTQPTV
jgi:hypothetical protein